MGKFIGSGLIATKTISSAQSILSGATDYSNSIDTRIWGGFTSLELVLSGASPSVTVTQQCSNDNSTWYDPKDSSNNALGAIATTATASRFIQFDPVMAPFIRLKYVAAADTTITARLNIKE